MYRPGGAALVLVTMTLALGAQPSERLTLGVMRRDGVILPFAAFDGNWSVPWPTSLRNLELPITLADVPKRWWGGEPPAAWTFWPIGDSLSPVPVSPSSLITILVGTEKRLGLRTGLVSAEPLPRSFELPYPKEGLALAGTVRVDVIATVSKRSAAWKELTTRLQEDVETAEQRAVEALRSNAKWSHPLSRDERRRIPVDLEAWYTSTLEQPGFALSYIEAVKKYPPTEDDDEGCGLETFVSGWIHTNSRQPRPKTDLTARITYCDRDGVSYMLPLGRLRVKNRTHWVFQISSWDREWYSVVEATPGRVRFVAEYFAGARPRPF